MKGIFIVLIVVHHFTIRLIDLGLLKPFGLVGYLRSRWLLFIFWIWNDEILFKKRKLSEKLFV